MKNFDFYYKRIKSISIKELLSYRISQLFNKNLIIRILPAERIKLESINKSALQWKKIFPQTKYEYPVFGETKLDLSQNINWLVDPLSGKTHELKYYTKYNKQDYNSYGDIKYVWEPARFHFLPFLSLESSEETESRSVELIENLLTSFSKQAKYLHSLHWTSGIEVAIRTINLIYTLLIKQDRGFSHKIVELLRVEIGKGITFLKHNLSLYSSANNHLLAELCALALYEIIFLKDKDKYITWFLREVDIQFNEDGVNFELSTGYHAEALEYAIVVLSIIENFEMKKKLVTQKTKEKIIKAGDFLFNCANYSTSYFGDCDNGHLIYPFFIKEFDYHQSVLQSVDILCNTQYSSLEKLDARNYLLFGDIDYKKIKKNKAVEDIVFRDSGYAFFYDEKTKTKLTFDFGAIGDNLLSAHGHSDQLSFTLTVNEKPVFVDNGTFQYHERFIKWRDYFRGVFAHNTISINGENHAKVLTRMSWTKTSGAKLLSYENNGEVVNIKAESNLFESRFGIRIRRELRFEKSKRRVSICDETLNDKEEKVDIYSILNIHPQCAVQKIKDSSFEVDHKIKVEISKQNNNEISVVSGALEPIRGWYSIRFGSKEKNQSVINHITTDKTVSTDLRITY